MFSSKSLSGTNGSNSTSPLCYDGINTLYGTCRSGGSSGNGVVFSVDINLNNITVLYNFTGGNDGSIPNDGLILIGNVLYGTCVNNGSNSRGTIFSIDITNPISPVFNSFGNLTTGVSPQCVLLYYNNTLYGSTYLGGNNNNNGVLFSISTTLTSYNEFYTFPLSGTNGAKCNGLIQYSGKLYGLCQNGGSGPTSPGTIFSISPDGTNFTRLHSFNPLTDGDTPKQNRLLLVNDIFYGTTSTGGVTGNGTIFSINPNDNNFTVLHTFTLADGTAPQSTLFYLNGKLYGTCSTGGVNGYGTIFSMNLDGSNYNVLHSFNNTDGNSPFTPIFANNLIYGTTSNGGSSNYGTIYFQSANILVCFKEDTKILTMRGYIPIQNLREGDLVKTLKHGYVPINMIGYRKMNNPICKERITDKLYVCNQSEYPDVFEDLVITGCHAILVDKFKNTEEREQTQKVLGEIYVTDNKYRLPACVDEKSKPYEKEGEFTIYHFALENDDYFMNYGIYANGLLVESCSKKNLKELSGFIHL